MNEVNYVICVEYKDIQKKQFGKNYVSFNPSDPQKKLSYDKLYCCSLEEIDNYFKENPQEKFLAKLKEENVFYFLNDLTDENCLEISIHYAENGKERKMKLLSEKCYSFDIEDFLTNLNTISRKFLYNKLGGYLTKNNIGLETKEWIKSLKEENVEELIAKIKNLPYIQKRNLKSIIYDIINTQEIEKVPNVESHVFKEESYKTRKLIQNEVA